MSFGFDTATKVYSELTGNLGLDAISAKKTFHFVRLMGRSASHITLEVALQTHPNLTLIGEEVQAKKQTLAQCVNAMVDLIIARGELGKNYGLIILVCWCEGLVSGLGVVCVCRRGCGQGGVVTRARVLCEMCVLVRLVFSVEESFFACVVFGCVVFGSDVLRMPGTRPVLFFIASPRATSVFPTA